MLCLHSKCCPNHFILPPTNIQVCCMSPTCTYLHLVKDDIGSQNCVPLLWVLSTVLFSPGGLSCSRKANHHEHLTLLRRSWTLGGTLQVLATSRLQQRIPFGGLSSRHLQIGIITVHTVSVNLHVYTTIMAPFVIPVDWHNHNTYRSVYLHVHTTIMAPFVMPVDWHNHNTYCHWRGLCVKLHV